MKPGDLTLGKTRAGLHVHQFVERQQQRLNLGLGWADQLGAGGLLLALLLQRAEHNGKYRRARGEGRGALATGPAGTCRL